MQKTLLSIAVVAMVAALPSAPQGGIDSPLVGVTLPSKVAAVAPEQAGKIVEVPVAEGERVEALQVLFRLNSRLEELEVERLRALAESQMIRRRAEVSLRYAEQEEHRVRDLRDQQISSERDLQVQAHEVELAKLRLQQANLEQAQAENELAQAIERLDQRTLRSPFAGIVTQRFKSDGEAVERFVPVIEVMCLDPLWIEFDCPVANEHLFRVGGEVVVAPSVRPSDRRVARILYVSMKATASSHTFMVRAAVANEDLRWKTGLKMVIQPPTVQPPPSTPGK